MKYILIFFTLLSLLSCKTSKDLPTVQVVDINKYSGLWYEIARLPNSFEKGLKCATATYIASKNGKIEVINKGYELSEVSKLKQIKGTAWVPDPNYQGRLKVRFFWPFAGDYYIISLDENYTWALIGSPSRNFLWILSKNKILDDKVYSELIDTAKKNGFDVNKVIKIDQGCN